MTVNQMPSTNNPAVSNVMRPLQDAAGWMKLVGTLAIINGVVLALTIVGLVIAWLPIWMGILINRAADDARAATMTGDEARAIAATNALRTVFRVYGVFVLIGIVFAIAIVVLSAALLVSESS